MQADIEVREAAPDEHGAAGAVVADAYRAFYDSDLGDYGRLLRDVATRALSTTILVAVAADTIVGCVTYVPDVGTPFSQGMEPGEASIRMLATLPAWQRHGIGRALSQACIDRARTAGKRAVMLHADDVMLEARHLYEHLGFRRDVRRDFAPTPDVLLRCYVLPLDAAEQ